VRDKTKARTIKTEGQARPRFAAIDEDGFSQHFSAPSWAAAERICAAVGWGRLGRLNEK